MEELQKWIEMTKVYPPAEIFYQSNKQKQERRCQEICDELFTFEPTNANHPASKMRLMWQLWRDFEVLLKLGHRDMNRFEVVTANLAFTQAAANAIRVMEDVYKKDNQLWQHYKQFQKTPQQLRDLADKAIILEGI